MSQLYAQLASRPDPWLLGRTSAGLCTLQAASPLVVTYSGGSPAPDTIAAGSVATVYGGSAVAFDASSDVWVVLTAPGAGALQVVKEADLAAVTGDWAGLARIAQHSTEPYQPQAYLAAGGLGSAPPDTTTVTSSVAAKARTLWTGSANTAPPTGWNTVAYDDSAWAAAVVNTGPGGGMPTQIWPEALSLSGSEQALFRQQVNLPSGALLTAALTYGGPLVEGYWINGHLVSGSAGNAAVTTTVDVPIAWLSPGGPNLIAAWMANTNVVTGYAACVFSLAVQSSGALLGGGGEGDLLAYQAGAWNRLPIGTSGQELTVVAGEPAWATPAGGTVTSVQVAVPAPLSASGGPLTASGTITLAWASGQTANRVLASPDGTTGAVSLRALVGNDIPVDASTIVSSAGTIKGNYQAGSGVSISGNTISATGSGGSVTSVALTLPSSVFSTSGSPVTTAGTLAVSLQSQAAHTFWGGPSSGSAAAPTFRTLQSSDLPAAAGAGGKIHAHGHFI